MKKIVLLAFATLALTGCPKIGVICSSSEVRCGNTCANLQVNPQHCGACGIACPTGFQCKAGACACPAGLAQCGQACVDLTSNPSHCGTCGTACGDAELCESSQCKGSCSPGHLACSGACVDPTSDRLHCGDCTTACAQGTACRGGHCQSDLFAACFNSGEIYGLDAAGEVASSNVAHAPPTEPQGLAFHGPTRLEVADPGTNQLITFDVGTDLSAEANPDGIGQGVISVTSSGDRAYVVNSNDATLDVLDLTRPAGARRLCPPSTPGCAATVHFDPGSFPEFAAVAADAVYVSLQGNTMVDNDTAGNKVARVLLSDFSIDKLTPIPASQLQATGTQARPNGLYANTATNKLYVALANLKGYSAEGPGLVAVFTLPDLTLSKVIQLGSGCVNAVPVFASGNLLYVGCGPKYDPSTFAVVQPGALAAVDMTQDAPAFAPQILSCPTGAAGCAIGGVSRITLAAGKVFLGDLANGRLFTADPATGQILRGPANPIALCPAPDGGFNFIGDVAAAP